MKELLSLMARNRDELSEGLTEKQYPPKVRARGVPRRRLRLRDRP